ncbi:MAG: UDP-N-acetylmuramate dehydrogenase [Candidatus Pacebacteria bacterium]|nr:UDP-N-acetylmuramate dehydrogenase [Candidatus Paceibacterota bacterium]
MRTKPKFKERVSLAKYSHYKIGGPARFFFEPKDERETAWAVKEAKKRKLAIFILSGGTNLLISDEGFDGLVIHPAMRSIKAKMKDGTVEVGAGATMADLLKLSAAKGLSGLEWAGGLPGTVGGAVRGNAGCFGGETKDAIVSVRSFNMGTMKFVTRTAAQCAFHYRDSIFKRNSRKRNGAEIVLSATFRLARGDKRAIAKAIREKIEYRRNVHPLDYPNIGSTFKNVPLHAVHKKGSSRYARAVKSGVIMFRGSRFSVKTDPLPVISAAKLISESGLRGVSMGGAMISPMHPNFIVNVLNAGSYDVVRLIMLAKIEVRRKFGVDLEEEVQVI